MLVNLKFNTKIFFLKVSNWLIFPTKKIHKSLLISLKKVDLCEIGTQINYLNRF